MNRQRGNLIASLTLLLLSGLPVHALASTRPVGLGSDRSRELLARRLAVDWVEPVIVIRAVTREEASRPHHVPTGLGRPVVREREAVLPDPANGQELVDRVVAHTAGDGPATPPTTTAATPQRR